VTRTVTVVGGSLAGLSSARALRERGFDGRVVVVGAEPRPPYDRPPLSKDFLAGTVTADELALLSPDDDELDLEWRLGRAATRLDPAARTVELDDGERIASDGVVLATGAAARPLDDSAPDGLHTLRTVADAEALRERLRPGARLVVVGAGFVGAEVASTASALGVTVTVVEQASIPFERALGPDVAAVCARLHERNGVTVYTGVGVRRVLANGAVRGVELADERMLAADVVVAGLGARPCVDWLVGSGVELDGGVRTDAGGATNLPGVVAVGDCAASYRRYTGTVTRLEHWTNAAQQPAEAVATLLGQRPPAHPAYEVPYFWSDQYGCRLQFAGHREPGDRVDVVEGDLGSTSFLAVYRRGGEPVAVFGMNQPRLFGRWRRQLAARLPSMD
jgi:3-phenylpropionate/trans-cinnamate dioxygenase ferredoxin reductase component